MTANPGAFALAELHRSVSYRYSGRERTSQSRAYQAGRLAEARILAAQGAALGLYPKDLVNRWLGTTFEKLRKLDVESTVRMPSIAHPDELMNRWRAHEPTDTGRRQFDQTLAIRHALDADPAMRKFLSLLLFATDVEWEQAVDKTNPESPRRGGSAGGSIIDGAYRSSWLCAEALSILDGTVNWVADWPELMNQQLVDADYRPVSFGGFSALTESGKSVPDLVADTLSFAGDRGGRAPSRSALSGLYRGMLESWAAAPAGAWRRNLPDDDWALDRLADPKNALLPYNLEYDMPWTALLWRLAPTDFRTAARYREALGLVHRYLGSEHVRWVLDLTLARGSEQPAEGIRAPWH